MKMRRAKRMRKKREKKRSRINILEVAKLVSTRTKA